MEKKIFIGAAYYPELWDEREIEKDILRCKELGVNIGCSVRIQMVMR